MEIKTALEARNLTSQCRKKFLDQEKSAVGHKINRACMNGSFEIYCDSLTDDTIAELEEYGYEVQKHIVDYDHRIEYLVSWHPPDKQDT